MAGKIFGKADCAFAAVETGANGNDFADAGGLGAGKDFGKVVPVFGIIEMRVRVVKCGHDRIKKQKSRIENSFDAGAGVGEALVERGYLFLDGGFAGVVRRFLQAVFDNRAGGGGEMLRLQFSPASSRMRMRCSGEGFSVQGAFIGVNGR